LSFLPVEEHKSVLRFKFDRDKHLALANLLLRRHYFSQLLNKGWFDIEFGKYPGGKPYIVSRANFIYGYLSFMNSAIAIIRNAI
jgi:phosphopantetheinyl transferase